MLTGCKRGHPHEAIPTTRRATALLLVVGLSALWSLMLHVDVSSPIGRDGAGSHARQDRHERRVHHRHED
jgi:hypothetical protein